MASRTDIASASRTDIAPQLVLALSHHTRQNILEALEAGPLSVRALADRLSLHRRTVARHAKELQRVGLIRGINTAAGRVIYSAPIPERVTDSEWAQTPRPTRHRAVAAALERMRTAAMSALVGGGFDRDTIHLSRTKLKITESAWADLSQRYMEWLDEIEALQREAPESDEPTVDATAILMLFEAQPTVRDAPIPHRDAALPREGELKNQSMDLCEGIHGMIAKPVTDWACVVDDADELGVLGRTAIAAQEQAPDPAASRVGGAPTEPQ